METKNKIAVVTGGSRGLGRNASLALAKKGIDVVLTYHSNKQDAENVVSEIRASGRKAEAYQLDTRNVQSFDHFLQQVTEHLQTYTGSPNFDYLINNAGTGVHAAFAETTEAQVDDMINTHYKGVFFLTQKALAYLNDGGAIVNISTGLARFSMPGFAAYASMKGAIETLTLYQAKELGARGIRVNAVAPGAIATDFGGGATRDVPEVNSFIKSVTALGRVGQPDDIGSVVAFLCTDEARWITGQRIEISGGMNL
ncbi:SDR family oxidoreductase [Olivibacter sp. SDN3]|uniref:SDR family NAD(P)-dependent oxidoreductase n=1 Tax=Olivibacter sp. SDN3 TaxID=2764720 RepID=UPI001650ED0E|nr:SDR family oxidoreductase [Olivibacter sp. SDN3]QNL52310.1 SDR family oxidoreductase [Olivibacter sp. SDN3]